MLYLCDVNTHAYFSNIFLEYLLLFLDDNMGEEGE